jgi:hypothetical protein
MNLDARWRKATVELLLMRIIPQTEELQTKLTGKSQKRGNGDRGEL